MSNYIQQVCLDVITYSCQHPNSGLAVLHKQKRSLEIRSRHQLGEWLSHGCTSNEDWSSVPCKMSRRMWVSGNKTRFHGTSSDVKNKGDTQSYCFRGYINVSRKICAVITTSYWNHHMHIWYLTVKLTEDMAFSIKVFPHFGVNQLI